MKPSRLLVVAMLACIAFCVVLALDWIPGLRGDFGWRWPYEVPNAARLLPALVTVAIYVIGSSRIRNTRLLLLWCFLGAIAIPLACLFLLGDPYYLLATRTLSGQTTGAHMAGAEITNLAYTAQNWPTIMPTYYEPGHHAMMSVHIALSPPGLPFFYYALDRMFGAVPALADPLGMPLRYLQCHNLQIMAYSNAQLASAWFGILMPVWAALAVFPLYWLGGKLAAIWWALIPSLGMFSPSWNTFYPLLALGAFVCLRAGLSNWDKRREQAAIYLIASGIFVSIGTFMNVSNPPLIGFLGLYTLIFCLQRTEGWRGLREAIYVGVLFGVGLISVWTVYYLMSAVTPYDVLSTALGLHLGFERPYLPWVYLHLYDLALFTGLPLVIVALAAIWKGLSHRRFDLKAFDPLGTALIATLVILAISGTARGETGRVWLFFVPFILILAARLFGGSQSRSAILVTVTQAITLITLVGFLRVMQTEFNDPPLAPPGPPIAQVSADTLPAPASFASDFTLIGQHTTATPQGIDLTLSWRSDRQVAVPYYLSALLVGPDKQAIPPAVNWQPFDTRYPLTCWRPGQIITETQHIPLPAQPSAGDYWISLSAFDIRDGSRVPVTQFGAASAAQIGLGPIPLK